MKLLNLTYSVYSFNNNGSETEKSHQKYLLRKQSMLAGDHVVTQAVWDKGARELASHVDTWVHKHARRVGSEHVSKHTGHAIQETLYFPGF